MPKKEGLSNAPSSDITERKRVEEKLKRQKAYFQQLFDNSPDAIAMLDDTDRVVQVNRGFETLFGYRAEEVKGRFLYYMVVPEDRIEEASALARAALNNQVSRIETVRKHKDGSLVDVSLLHYPIQFGNKTVAVYAIYSDITERKQMEEALWHSEEKYRGIFEKAPASIMLLDKDGQIVDVNPYHITHIGKGKTTQKDYLGENILTLPGTVSAGLSETFAKLLKGELLDLKDVYYPTTMAGPSRYFNVRGVPLFKEGKVIGAIVIREDLTERKRMEEASQESEQKYRALFENLNDATFLADTETGRILDTNKQGEVLLGRTREEIIGMHQSELHPPERANDYRQRFATHVQKGRVADYDGEAIRKDGSIVPVNISAAPVTIGGKRLIIGLFRDITERKRTEEALVDEATRRRILVEQSRDGIVILDQNGKVYEANQQFAKMLGYSPEEVAQLHVWDWDTQWTREQLLEMLQSVDAAGDHFQTYHRRKDGTVYDVEISTNGAVCVGQKLVFCVCRDITERKQMEEALQESEERYRDLFENANDLIQSVAPDGHFLYVNKIWRKLLGYSKKEVANLTLWDITHPDFIPHCREVFRKVMSGETVNNFEAVFVAKDGKLVTVEGSANCKFVDGRPVATRGIFRDITERKRMEQEIQDKNEQLDVQNEELRAVNEELMAQQQELIEKTREVERATQLKSEFLANMSHELRTPLNVIIGFSELMIDKVPGKINEKQRQCLNDILDSGKRLLNLINEVLDLSKIESGRVELKLENIALTDVIESLRTSMMSIVAPKKQSLDIEIEEGLPPVHADESKIGQVLLNLVNNSSKFTPNRGKLKIEVVRENNWCQVSVIDNGIGIKKEDQKRIFEPFCWLDNPLTKEKSGTGLGLALVETIVERYGGQIWVESEYGKGSRFTFTLPLATAD